MDNMIKALQFDHFGALSELKIREITEPIPAENEIRVRVAAVSLNPMDWAIMASSEAGARFAVQLPATFAYDFAGEVDAVGGNVSNFKVGDHVFGTTYKGAAQEKLVIPVDPELPGHAFHTPANVSDIEASTLGVAGATAVVALRKAHVTADDTLLVGGAAGGVGVFVAQLARLLGAKVIGTASDSSRDFLENLGAEQVKYGESLKERLANKKISAAIELFGRETVDTALKLGVSREKISSVILYDVPEGITTATGGEVTVDEMEDLANKVSTGKIKIPIAASYPLSDFEKAVKSQMGRHTHGKIVLSL